MDPKHLPSGLYDALVDRALDAKLTQLSANQVQLEPLGNDREAAAQALARQVHERVLATLRSLTDGEEDTAVERQVALTNTVLEHLTTAANGVTLPTDHIAPPARKLLAVHEPSRGLVDAPRAIRPEVPLSSSELMVNGRHDLRLGPELARELASADSVDLLCSFLKWSGYRLIEGALQGLLARRPGKLRVLTTAYMGATERRALDALAELGAEVRVSYDAERTRLHAKAWLFHRESGYSTAYIGSSNLSHAAMLDGLEWNVRLSRVDNGAILEKFGRVFEQYWSDGTFEPYDPARDAARWDEAVRRQVSARSSLLLSIHVDPKPHQAEALELLAAERSRGHTRNLVVAATGTGKTFIAAFDFRDLTKRLRAETGRRPSLLFVAHRHEILEQSMNVFRVVLGDPVFGERLGNGEVPRSGEHVFANIQSLHEDKLAELAPDAFDVVIVDEFHHAASRTYDTLLQRLRPRYLLGLTATPERTDGRSVLGWFDERIAVELRLWKALDQGLLSPFQYFGVSDGTNLSRDDLWTRTGYDSTKLRNLYTANDVWIQRVLQEVGRRVARPLEMRALGFCVDIDHAEFVAERFTRAGLASVALSQRTSTKDRTAALARLQAGDLRAIFSVDLLNEGVDVPDVDTVLFLRPTESASLFLQQLGRGLRRRPDKECLTVLDFIGGAHRKFRFDARFRAIVGGTRAEIARQVERGFPHLPSGCSIQLDRVAAEVVLTNIQQSLGRGDEALVADLQQAGDIGLAEFLRKASLDLDDVFSRPGRSFTRLRRRAGFAVLASADAATEERFEKALARLLHVNDAERLDRYRALLEGAPTHLDDPWARMLFVSLGWANDPLAEIPRCFDQLASCAPLRKELLEVFRLLADRSKLTPPLGGRLAELPLAVHATYGLDEVMAALDERDSKGRSYRLREGVFHSKRHRADLLFVTLEKSEDEYSPTTMYRDFVLTRTRFHWESQSSVHADTKTGRRYVEHAANDHAILLFVRERRESRPGVTMPYTFLGPCQYVRHTGARPMAIEWELDHPIPFGLFQEVKVAAG